MALGGLVQLIREQAKGDNRNMELLARNPSRSRAILAPLACVGLTLSLLAACTNAAAQISPAHPELLQEGIIDAYNAGQKSVVIPAGIYQIPLPAGAAYHLDFENMTNFEIDARGATFVFQDQTASGILFQNCDTVWFHGATLYFATPPFSQGVILAVAADGSSLDMQIEKGYPTNLDDPHYFTAQIIGHLFDNQTRWWKHNVQGDVYGSKTQRLGPDTFRIFTGGSNGGGVVGDLIGFRSGVGGHNVQVQASSRMNLTDLTILNSPAFGVAEGAGGDLGPNYYSSITIKRGLRPPGASTDPLFSSTADGLHSSEARHGPDVENCSFESMPDDGIAVHGHYSWVMEASGNTLIVSNTVVSGANGANFLVGDPLRLLDARDQLVGEAVVAAIVPLPNYQNSRKSARQTTEDFSVGPYYRITLDRVLKADFDYLASNPSANGSGFVLRNNTIMNHRGQGMILKGDNGTVEGNVIDGSSEVGIKVAPSSYWAESGYSRNMVIRNNTIRNVGYWAGTSAALQVAPDSQYGLSPAGDFQNILIDGNTFENFDVPAMFISSVSGVVIRNNTFWNIQRAVPFQPNTFGQSVSPGAIVFVTLSDGVQFQGNTASQLGPYNTMFVQAAPGVTVQGTAYESTVAGSDGDFSSTQGAGGWWYGYFPAGNVNAFTQLPTYNAQSNWWQHPTFGPPWTFVGGDSVSQPNSLDYGSEEWATRRWISTFSGAANITGHLASVANNPNNIGGYTRIYLNHNLIYEHHVAHTDFTGTNYSVAAALKLGDILDFALAPNGTADTFVSSSIISVSLTPTAPGSAPSISAVSNSASGQKDVAPGTYISIYGSNFAPAGFLDDWSKSVIGGKLPTQLDGMSVSIGGKATYVVAVTSNQINVLTPAALGTGSMTVTVTTVAGTSAPFVVTSQSVEPALFGWPATQVVATHLDYSYAAKNGTLAIPTVPAKPGETITLWGTGFGPTTPFAPDGQIVPPGSYNLSDVSVTVGGQPATVLGAALSPGLADVYQIAIQVPSGLSNGDYLVVATVNGAPSPISVLLTVAG